MRTLLIWITGLLAGAVIGGALANIVDGFHGVDFPAVWGVLGGMLVFACVRQWRSEERGIEISWHLFPDRPNPATICIASLIGFAIIGATIGAMIGGWLFLGMFAGMLPVLLRLWISSVTIKNA
jgi:hypothetical protein